MNEFMGCLGGCTFIRATIFVHAPTNEFVGYWGDVVMGCLGDEFIGFFGGGNPSGFAEGSAREAHRMDHQAIPICEDFIIEQRWNALLSIVQTFFSYRCK